MSVSFTNVKYMHSYAEAADNNENHEVLRAETRAP